MKHTITLKGHSAFMELPLALPVGFTQKNAVDANLTPAQRVWKARRQRWAAWNAKNNNHLKG